MTSDTDGEPYVLLHAGTVNLTHNDILQILNGCSIVCINDNGELVEVPPKGG